MDIMVLNGDGIGPEIMDAGTKILKKLNDNFGVNINPVKNDVDAFPPMSVVLTPISMVLKSAFSMVFLYSG